MTEEEVLEITPDDFQKPQSGFFKTEVKEALIKSATQILGKVVWFFLPKKLKLWINAVIVYMENH